MATRIYRYRANITSVIVGTIIVIISIIQIVLQLSKDTDNLGFMLIFTYILLFSVGMSRIINGLKSETIVFYEEGLYVYKETYTFDDILSIKLNEKSILIRLKKKESLWLNKRFFVTADWNEVVKDFKQLEARINQ